MECSSKSGKNNSRPQKRNGKPQQRCLICGHRFKVNNKSLVVAHMQTHTNERPFKCSTCKSDFRSKLQLQLHIRYVHGQEKRPKRNRKQCVFCLKSVPSDQMNYHLKIHIREKAWSCSVCEKEFITMCGVKGHMKSHTKEQGAPCIFCGKTFSVRQHPYAHLRTHIKEKPYSCTKCPKLFTTKVNLKTHNKDLHTKQRIFECNICKKSFEKSDLETHIGSHLTERPFKCQSCKKIMYSSEGLKKHLKIHMTERPRPFQCKKCNKSYIRLYNLEQHESKEHAVTDCVFCEKMFPLNVINSHIQTHLREKPFHCKWKLCGQEFTKLIELMCHYRVSHSTLKRVPAQCVFCSKVFPSRSHLDNHLMWHVLEKPYDCTKCSASFALFWDLQAHLRRVHLRERRFPCVICGRAFDTRSHCNRHFTSHFNEKPYQCSHCGRRYGSRDAYSRHMKCHTK